MVEADDAAGAGDGVEASDAVEAGDAVEVVWCWRCLQPISCFVYARYLLVDI